MFNFQAKRESATQLLTDKKSIKKLKEILKDLLEERDPYKRKGYPRAGAFDRLSMIVLEGLDDERLKLSFFHPAPRMIHQREIIIKGQLKNLVSTSTPLPINALFLVGYHRFAGAIKYGEALNLQFSQLEQGIFLQALHDALSQQKIANHLQGGLRLNNLSIALPLDMEGITGLIV